MRGGLATAGFLRTLGVQPALGRIFTDDEFGPDNDKVVLLSHAFWTSRYGSDPEVLGSVLQRRELLVKHEVHLELSPANSGELVVEEGHTVIACGGVALPKQVLALIETIHGCWR